MVDIYHCYHHYHHQSLPLSPPHHYHLYHNYHHHHHIIIIISSLIINDNISSTIVSPFLSIIPSVLYHPKPGIRAEIIETTVVPETTITIHVMLTMPGRVLTTSHKMTHSILTATL